MEMLYQLSYPSTRCLRTQIVFTGIPTQDKKAGDGNRTHVSSLEGWRSTIEPRPQKDISYIIQKIRVLQKTFSEERKCNGEYNGKTFIYYNKKKGTRA